MQTKSGPRETRNRANSAADCGASRRIELGPERLQTRYREVPPCSNPSTTSPSPEQIADNVRKANARLGSPAVSGHRGLGKAAGRTLILESISCCLHFQRCHETLPPSPAEESGRGRVRQEDKKRSKVCSRPANRRSHSPGAHAKACIVRSWSVPPSSKLQPNFASHSLAVAVQLALLGS